MEEITEKWRKVRGFNNYRVSDLGRVKRKSIPLNPCVVGGRSRKLTLMQDGKTWQVGLHTLVAAVWLAKPADGSALQALNGDKTDCRVANLFYAPHAAVAAKRLAPSVPVVAVSEAAAAPKKADGRPKPSGVSETLSKLLTAKGHPVSAACDGSNCPYREALREVQRLLAA